MSRHLPAWGGGKGITWVKSAALLFRQSPRLAAFSVINNSVVGFIPALQVAWTASAIQSVTDAVTSQEKTLSEYTGQVLFYGIGLGLLALISHVIMSFEQYLQTVLSGDLDAKIARIVMEKGVRLELEQYEDAETYDKIQRASRDGANRIFQMFVGTIGVFRDTVTLVSMAGVLFTWNWGIAVAVLLSPVPALFASMYFAGKQYELEYGRSTWRRRVAYLQYLTTTDHPFKEVRLFGLAPRLLQQHRDLVGQFFAQDRRLARKTMLVGGSLGLATVALGSGAVIVAMLSALGSVAVGRLAGTIQAITVVQGSATGLLTGIVSLYQNNLFAGNLFEYLELPEKRISGGNRPFPKRLTLGVEFKSVSFTYPGTEYQVLDQVSLKLPANACTALVGTNGSGKTTLIKLLNRLYEPTSGEILIDGHPISDYDIDSLRNGMSVLFQDFMRYETSLRENVGFGHVPTMEEDARVNDAIERGGASDVVVKLEGGLDAMLGRHFLDGSQLSLGQWQKVALSRALMRDAALLVLDEPTASIDAKAEAEIFERLRRVSADTTSVIIAHRFATVRIADHILVIDKGRIAEAGNHTELMEVGGIYARMFNLQARGYRD